MAEPGLWGAVRGGAIAAIIGFSQRGWQTAASADHRAQERAGTGVFAALVLFCVAQAQQDTDQATLAKLRTEQSSYSRSDLVHQVRWATLGVVKSLDGALAVACSAQLYAMKTS